MEGSIHTNEVNLHYDTKIDLDDVIDGNHGNDKKSLTARKSVSFSKENAYLEDTKDEDQVEIGHNFSDCNGNNNCYDLNGENVLESSKPATSEDEEWLNWIKSKFEKIGEKKDSISRTEFVKFCGKEKAVISDRIFTMLGKNKGNVIAISNLIHGIELFIRGTPTQKLKYLFDLTDTHGNGALERDELKVFLSSCIKDKNLSLDDDKLEALVDLIFDTVGVDSDELITFKELENELLKHPGVVENLTFSGLQWIKPPSSHRKENTFKSRYLTRIYIRNNLRKISFLLVYLLINIGLGCYAGWSHRESNAFLIIARICGMNLNFNCTFIVILVLRTLLTKIRETRLHKYLPIDQHILFHKMVGVTIALYSVVHVGGHIVNAVVVSQSGSIALWEMMLTTKAGVGWILGSSYITGWILLLILGVMVIFSLPCLRQRGYFEVFYFSHMLYIPFWVCCILHAPDFWKWFVVPGFVFLCEKLIRTRIVRTAKYGDVIIQEVNLLPSKVSHLVIKRPKNFKFKAGDYLFLNIPQIAKYEWHPFTISSAPELQEDKLSLHIMSAGSWTNRVYEFFDNYEVNIDGFKENIKSYRFRKMSSIKGDTESDMEREKERKRRRADSLRRIKEKNKRVKVKCYIDGPYGTGAREILDSEHAVLMCSGIGVTPMASILQSILLRYQRTKNCCPNCSFIWHDSDKLPQSLMNLRKVDFIWINRSQKNFEWFVSILSEIEIYQQVEERTTPSNDGYLIDMQLYMTGAKQKTDMRGLSLQMALDLMRQKERIDLITGLRTKAEPGRPNFNKLFHDISLKAKGNVKVFYCGNQSLAITVKQYCEKYKFGFSKEHF